MLPPRKCSTAVLAGSDDTSQSAFPLRYWQYCESGETEEHVKLSPFFQSVTPYCSEAMS